MATARATAAEWAIRTKAWRASGEKADVFAKRHGWNGRTLTWWASRLARRTPEAPRIDFVRLLEREEPPAASHAAAGVEVVLATGRAIRVPPGADLELLRAVVDALEAH